VGGQKPNSNFSSGSKNFLLVPKSKIAENGDYNLSGDRYRVATDYSKAKWEMVELGEVCELVRGITYSKNDEVDSDGHKVLRAMNISLDCKLVLNDIKQISKNLFLKDHQKLKENDIFICLASGSKDHIGKVAFIEKNEEFYFGGFMGAIRVLKNKILPHFLYSLLMNEKFNNYLREAINGANINNLSGKILNSFKIPLPPLEIQEQIVHELDGYSAIITGAKQIVTNWKPKIDIDPSWEMVELEKIITTITPPAKIPKEFFGEKGIFPIIDQSQEDISGWTDDEECVVKFAKPVVIFGDHTCVIKYSDIPFAQGADGIKILATNGQLIPKFLYFALLSNPLSPDGYQRHFSKLKRHKIPLPPLETQQQIVSQIEVERTLVESAKKLIEIYEQKTKAVIKKLWEE
jgi:type I restriction enzyme M protein